MGDSVVRQLHWFRFSCGPNGGVHDYQPPKTSLPRCIFPVLACKWAPIPMPTEQPSAWRKNAYHYFNLWNVFFRCACSILWRESGWWWILIQVPSNLLLIHLKLHDQRLFRHCCHFEIALFRWFHTSQQLIGAGIYREKQCCSLHSFLERY